MNIEEHNYKLLKTVCDCIITTMDKVTLTKNESGVDPIRNADGKIDIDALSSMAASVVAIRVREKFNIN